MMEAVVTTPCEGLRLWKTQLRQMTRETKVQLRETKGNHFCCLLGVDFFGKQGKPKLNPATVWGCDKRGTKEHRMKTHGWNKRRPMGDTSD